MFFFFVLVPQSAFAQMLPDISVPSVLAGGSPFTAGVPVTFEAQTTNESWMGMDFGNTFGFSKIGQKNTDGSSAPVVFFDSSHIEAYVGSGPEGDDLEVFDVSGDNPVKIGGLNWINSGSVTDISSCGGRLCVVTSDDSDATNRLVIIDALFNPSNPTIVGKVAVSDKARSIAFTIDGNYAFVGSEESGDDIEVFDISNPASPTKISGIDLASGQTITGLTVSDEYLYAVSDHNNLVGDGINPPDFRVIDISDPSNIGVVGELELFSSIGDATPYVGFGLNSIDFAGSKVYIAGDEDVFSVDISNPSNPVLSEQIGDGRFTDVYYYGGYGNLYVVSESNGVDVYRDVSGLSRMGHFTGKDSDKYSRISPIPGPQNRVLVGRWGGSDSRIEIYKTSSLGRFCIDNTSCFNDLTGKIGINDIDITAFPSSITSEVWFATGGTHTITFCANVVDPETSRRNVEEGEYNNNCLTSAIFNVAPAVNTLKVCENNCGSGRFIGSEYSSPGIFMSIGEVKNVFACYGPAFDCSDEDEWVGGIPVTWNGDNNLPNDSITVIANVGGEANIYAQYSGTENIFVSLQEPTPPFDIHSFNIPITVGCVDPDPCASAPQGEAYCTDKTYTITDACGAEVVCPGRRACGRVWKEVSPK